jgi:hypothetical protein
MLGVDGCWLPCTRLRHAARVRSILSHEVFATVSSPTILNPLQIR